jgi:hypothetical protein
MRNFVNRDNRESVISALGLRLVPRLTDILARLISFWHSERLGYALHDLPPPMLGTLLVRALTYLTPSWNALPTIAQVFRRTLYRVS